MENSELENAMNLAAKTNNIPKAYTQSTIDQVNDIVVSDQSDEYITVWLDDHNLDWDDVQNILAGNYKLVANKRHLSQDDIDNVLTMLNSDRWYTDLSEWLVGNGLEWEDIKMVLRNSTEDIGVFRGHGIDVGDTSGDKHAELIISGEKVLSNTLVGCDTTLTIRTLGEPDVNVVTGGDYGTDIIHTKLNSQVVIWHDYPETKPDDVEPFESVNYIVEYQRIGNDGKLTSPAVAMAYWQNYGTTKFQCAMSNDNEGMGGYKVLRWMAMPKLKGEL